MIPPRPVIPTPSSPRPIEDPSPSAPDVGPPSKPQVPEIEVPAWDPWFFHAGS